MRALSRRHGLDLPVTGLLYSSIRTAVSRSASVLRTRKISSVAAVSRLSNYWDAMPSVDEPWEDWLRRFHSRRDREQASRTTRNHKSSLLPRRPSHLPPVIRVRVAHESRAGFTSKWFVSMMSEKRAVRVVPGLRVVLQCAPWEDDGVIGAALCWDSYHALVTWQSLSQPKRKPLLVLFKCAELSCWMLDPRGSIRIKEGAFEDYTSILGACVLYTCRRLLFYIHILQVWVRFLYQKT